MTKVKCVLGYFDTRLNRHVDVDEVLEETDFRAMQLIKANVAVIVAEEEPAKEKKPRKKKEV